MEDEDQNSGAGIAAALAGLSSQYTTPEAQAIAKRTFNELYSERGKFNAEEQAQLSKLDATAQSAKDALKAARDKLLSQRYNEQAKWFALAGALGQGSKSGRFGEELGRVGNVLSENSVAKRKFLDDQQANALKLQLDMGDIDTKLVAEKLAALKARRDADKGLMSDALKVIGREIRPGRGNGSSSMSPFGKIAADEGLTPGTPQFTRRVQELYGIDLKQKQQAAGLDVSDITDEDKSILSSQYGVPMANVDPYRGLSTKARQQAIQHNMEQGQRALSALTDSDNTARAAIRQADRFMALNDEVPSGKLYDVMGIKWLTGFGAAAQEMDQITSDIARKQRQPGEGQVSNFDAQQFLNASPGRGKSYETNKNITTAIKSAKQLQLEQSEFLSNYLAVNQHLQGAKEAWNRYLEANPIFDPKAKPGSFKLNETRQDYKTWFRAQQAPRQAPVASVEAGDAAEVTGGGAATDQVDDELAHMTPEERKMALTPAQAKGGQVKGYAKGGKVSAVSDLVEALKAQIEAAMHRADTAYTAAPPPKLPPVPMNPALQRIGTDKEALLRRVAGNPGVEPVDAERMQSVNTVLDTVLANASKNTDASAGLRAEALWRQLQDLASKYKATGGAVGYAEGGKADEMEKRRNRDLITQLVRELGQGATYNFSDELLGAGSPDRLREERSALEDFGSDNPLTAMGLQGAGAVPTGMLAGAAGHKIMQAMKGSGPTFHPKLGMRRGKAAAVAALLERVLPKSAIGKMMVSGAVNGAVAGAGASQGDDVAGDAATQGAVGSILGPLGGLASKYGLGVARRGVDMLRGTVPKAADEKVLAALAKDTPNIDDVAKKVATDSRMGVPTTIGDAAGKNTASLMEAVAGKSGRGPAELAEKLEQRQLNQGQRVEAQVNKGLKPSEYFAEEQKLKDELYSNAKPLYDAAYTKSKPVPVRDIDFLFDSKDGKAALKAAVNLMNTRGIPIGKADMTGSVKKMSLQSLDYVKQALDDAITKEEGRGANYVATSRGSALRFMRNKLRDVLDNHSPDYKAARQQYAGDLEVLDALRQGREQFTKMAPKQIENAVANMSFAERDAFRTGVAQTLFDAIGKTPRGSNVAAKVVGTPALTEKLTPLFDNPKQAAKFNEALTREMQLHKQSSGAINNAARQRAASASAGLDDTPLADAADFALDAGQQAVFLPGIAQNTGGPYTTARVMQWVRNRLPMSEQTANEAADMLGVDDPKKAKAVIERLKAEGERLKKRAGVSDAVARAGARASAVATAPDPWAQSEDQP